MSICCTATSLFLKIQHLATSSHSQMEPKKYYLVILEMPEYCKARLASDFVLFSRRSSFTIECIISTLNNCQSLLTAKPQMINMKTTKLLKILMIIEKIKTLSVSVSSERRRRLTPCLLTANLPKTPLGESELLEPLFRYLPREGRGPRCKFEAFFVTGSMLVSSSPFFKPSNLLKWFQTHQTLVWSGRR